MGVVSPADMKLAAPGGSKYARVERERRYLLREVRVPETNEWVLKLTQKQTPAPPDFSRTLITNIYLSPYEFEVLSVFEGNELRKNRYPYEHEGRVYAVDLFLGHLHGLVLAETDFDDDA